jgi:hypothetical protein
MEKDDEEAPVPNVESYERLFTFSPYADSPSTTSQYVKGIHSLY